MNSRQLFLNLKNLWVLAALIYRAAFEGRMILLEMMAFWLLLSLVEYSIELASFPSHDNAFKQFLTDR